MRSQKGTNVVLSCIFILLIAGTLVFSSHAKINPEEIRGIWLFDEDDGNEIMDSSGNNHTGVANGGELKVYE